MAANYALSMFGLPVIRNLGALADELSLSPGLLYKLSVANHSFYRTFEMAKKSGGSRVIFAPSRDMKAVQAWILRNILDQIHVHQAATGFRHGRNIRDNAIPHQEGIYFLCLDIEDFFPSIPYAKVFNVFRSSGYSPHMAHIFTRLCTCDDRLPQGAVTSPSLSNIVCMRLDRRISSFVGQRNIAYTRYADDMTFSAKTPNRLSGSVATIRHIIEDTGFTLNNAKTRRMGPARQRRVTGLVVSDGKIGIGRKHKRRLRAAIHSLSLSTDTTVDHDKRRALVDGWLAHVRSVDDIGYRQLTRHAARVASTHGVSNLFNSADLT